MGVEGGGGVQKRKNQAKEPAMLLRGCMLVLESCFPNTWEKLITCAVGFACEEPLMGSLTGAVWTVDPNC